MTEGEWLACEDPARMLAWLGDGSETIRTRWQGAVAVRRWRTSERKLWLYLIAAHRDAADGLATHAGHHMLDVLAEWAEGSGSFAGIGEAADLAVEAERQWAFSSLIEDSTDDPRSALERITALCRRAGPFEARDIPPRSAPLLREVVGNPFRPPVIDPLWPAANDGAVRRMAEEVARLRDFRLLPILADALEDAGCVDDAILSHCRTPAGHVRGCWVIDTLLGRP